MPKSTLGNDVPRRLLVAAALIPLLAIGDASAQQSRAIGPPGDLPLPVFSSRRSDSDGWPKASISVERDAYVTVLAITPGVNRFAVQVLSPASPKDDGFIRPRHPQRLGYFSADAIGHRIARGTSVQPPIIIGITSQQKPDLSAFARGKGWATDLVINVPIDSATDLADVVAQAILRGDSVQFGVAQMPVTLPGLLSGSAPVPMAAPAAEAAPSRYLDASCYSANKSARGVCANFDDRPGAMRWLVRDQDRPKAPEPQPVPVKPPSPQ